MIDFKKNIRRYLILTVVIFCIFTLISGAVTVKEKTEYNLTGEKYRTVSFNSFAEMLKNY
ncbi:MAG: hypothetical protein ACI4GC_06730 [Acutalibacteraceae bacterium]